MDLLGAACLAVVAVASVWFLKALLWPRPARFEITEDEKRIILTYRRLVAGEPLGRASARPPEKPSDA